MKRAVLAPPALPASALAELKEWLGINTTREDALLGNLLNASLDICEAYTGVRAIVTDCEETWPIRPAAFSVTGWQTLSTRPVTGITGIETVAVDGSRNPLGVEDYELDIDADGVGRFRVLGGTNGKRVAVRFTAGLATGWDALPDTLRQGAIRLAAHHHRQRETGNAETAPPRAVAALWQPWRRMRLA
ncbi:head-tail connector protein [Croceicoccus bisphenolivorans]|uniref:head-tail connector protein n=1 Tax=Croceicoccus bisphenolivorans TaxID=1783232 RepID=UPI00082972D9|nr:phage head-tail connector protein [Croceicoccus bisphenolivorans]